MKAKEVMELLEISRRTLSRYITNGVIKGKRLPTGRYIYDDESVYKLADDKVLTILDTKQKQLTKKKKVNILESMITLSCELKGQFTLNELAYALLKSNLLTFQQQSDLIEALEL